MRKRASLTSNAQSAGQLVTEDRSLSNVREGMRNDRSATAVRPSDACACDARGVVCSLLEVERAEPREGACMPSCAVWSAIRERAHRTLPQFVAYTGGVSGEAHST